MKSVKVLLLLCLLLISQRVFAKDVSSNDESYFVVDVGLAAIIISEHERYGSSASEGTLAPKIGFGFGLDQHWGLTVNLLGKFSFGNQLASLEGNYTHTLSESWQLQVSTGILFGRGDPRGNCSGLCPEIEFSGSETSYIVGGSLIYKLGKNWGLKLSHKINGYRDGIKQTEFLVQYTW